MSDAPKPKFDRAVAVIAAKAVCDALKPVCLRLCCAGSLRRKKARVGDVEVLFVPKMDHRQLDLLAWGDVSLADEVIEALVARGVLAKRLNSGGSECWGKLNKLARHVGTGVPVDLFATTEECWWNYLVCRTGPAESNIRIAEAAKRMGWKWNPYGRGFTRGGALAGQEEEAAMLSEEAVFWFVGLPFAPPHLRG